MSQDLPSKQWSELSMFSRERMLCFVYGPPEDGFDIPAQGIRFQAANTGQ
jgi:hypothetical protein